MALTDVFTGVGSLEAALLVRGSAFLVTVAVTNQHHALHVLALHGH